MGRVLICRLSNARLRMVREDPGLVSELRKAIRDGDVPGALDLGELGGERRERFAAQLQPMGEAAWERAREALDGACGTPLRHDARILDPQAVAVIAAAMAKAPAPGPKGSLVRLAAELRGVLQDAGAAGEHVLVLGSSAEVRQAAAETQRQSAARREASLVAARAERWAARGMSELDERILRRCLHTAGAGLRDPRPDERTQAFADLYDRLFGPGAALRRLVIEEIRELVLLWASGGAGAGARRLAALMLARIACAAGQGGDVATEATASLRADVSELGPSFAEILAEMGPAATAAMGLVGARAQLAADVVLPRITDPRIRSVVQRAYQGDEAAFREGLESVEGPLLRVGGA